MTDAKIKANILSVYKDLGLSSSQAEGLDEADMTKEADTTKKADASIPKGANDIDSDDNKDNDDKDKDDINERQYMVVMTKTKTPCTLQRRGRRVTREVMRNHYSPRIRTATTMAITMT